MMIIQCQSFINPQVTSRDIPPVGKNSRKVQLHNSLSFRFLIKKQGENVWMFSCLHSICLEVTTHIFNHD